MALVAGVDSSTQSTKVLVVDAETGQVVREGAGSHPDGTECHPDHWWQAFQEAAAAAGGLDGVEAVAVGGQQHGMVLLDADGEVIRPALLWNDTRSAQAAADLTDELGVDTWVAATGLSLVASFTVTKLRWMADHEPEQAARVAAVCLPHDWLTWRLRGAPGLDGLVTDRSDASGTGYFDPVSNDYRRDLLAYALRRDSADQIVLPRVLGPSELAGTRAVALGLDGAVVGPGCGDNAGAALGLGLGAGQGSLSLGTSSVVATVSDTPVRDRTGLVAGFADATGRYLPLTCTINGAQIIDATCTLLGVDYRGFDELAASAEPGAGGVTFVPHLGGERTPNLPDAKGTLAGLTQANMTPANLARAAVEGLLCLLAFGLEAQRQLGVDIASGSLVGGAARSAVVRRLAPAVLGIPVEVPPPGQYVALGAARQAAWVLHGGDQPPAWPRPGVERLQAEPTGFVYQRYAMVAEQIASLVTELR